MARRWSFPAPRFALRAIRTPSFCCSATAPVIEAAARQRHPRSRRPRGSSTPTSPCRWTTSRARRCARAAGSRRMWLAIEAVKNGEADVAVSAGNTGALMAMAKFCLRTMAGIERPAIAAIWPTLRGESIVLDVGATIGADAQQLVDFAVMGSAMARVAVRHRAADRRPAQYRRRGGQGPRGGAGSRPHPARARPAAHSTITASSRATTSARARSTWSSPKALPAISR